MLCGSGCCQSKDEANLDMNSKSLSALEEQGTTRDQADEEAEEEDESSALATSYFDRELAELNRIKKRGGVENMKPYKFKSGAVYKGQWENNMRHGFGTQTWSDGSTFSGQWKQNIAVGKGHFTHSDGDVYIGEWSNNMANGLGVYYHKG